MGGNGSSSLLVAVMKRDEPCWRLIFFDFICWRSLNGSIGRLDDEDDVGEWSGAPWMLGGESREFVELFKAVAPGVLEAEDEAAADGDKGDEGIISSLSSDDRDDFLEFFLLSNNFLKKWNFSIFVQIFFVLFLNYFWVCFLFKFFV